MNTLSSSPNLPNVRASIIATKGWLRTTWKLHLTMPGPDGRYNIATATLNKSSTSTLARILERALSNVNKVKRISGLGVYKKRIGQVSGVVVEVYESLGSLGTRIQMKTSTRYYYRSLSRSQTEQWIRELRIVPKKGNELTRTLKKM